MSVLVSCEAGAGRVPVWLWADLRARPINRRAASGSRSPVEPLEWLQRTAGDSAAAHAAEGLARRWNAPLIRHEYSLDVIDVTKSPAHRQLFRPQAKGWPREVKTQLVQRIHRPYRDRLRQHLAPRLLRGATVIHLSVRSFGSLSGGKRRRADLGLLYDPGRDEELDLCLDWIDEMYDALPMLRVRRNYPRRGTTDSITKAMRAEFAGAPYLGIELLLNRAWSARPVAVREEVLDGIADCFAEVAQLGHTEAA